MLRTHDRWDRDELLAYQARRLRELREYAVARSPFYRELHRGREDAPLSALPVLTKSTLMDRFDDLVTDRAIRFADVETYLARATATDVFRGRYRVMATGGTTGRRGVFLADPGEWRTVVTSYARASDWAGAAAGVTNRLRLASCGSRHPSHQSSIVGATAHSPLMPMIRFDASDRVDEVVQALNRYRPDILIGYPSVLCVLADEQQAGRLAIRPRAILPSAEVLTDEARARLRAAFGVAPTNVYAATETAGIASECPQGRMHAYEDLVIPEIVDEDNRPVRPGEYGARLLVTVLSSRTQPLIRYEISDRVSADDRPCPDGRPYAVLGGIEGRQEEVLTLCGVRVHPKVFDVALEKVQVTGWQVIETDGRLRVLVAGLASGIDDADVADRVASGLRAVGALDVPIAVERVAAIPRTALGKAPLIRRSPRVPLESEQSREPVEVR
jgi:phenylacetate-coenzyme A ligase PaaK-like adenylate-forming protein